MSIAGFGFISSTTFTAQVTSNGIDYRPHLMGVVIVGAKLLDHALHQLGQFADIRFVGRVERGKKIPPLSIAFFVRAQEDDYDDDDRSG